jgi:hypothetical protein
MKRWRWITCFALWVMIAMPYAPIVWHLSKPFGGGWSLDSTLAAVVAIFLGAVLGMTILSFLDNWWAFAGGISGGFLSWAVLAWLNHFLIPGLSVVSYEIVPWSAVAGIVSGGLWWRLRGRDAGFVFDETNFLWTTVAVWILVLRLGQIIIAGELAVRDSLFIEELLVFPVVLLLSSVSSKLLYKRLKGSLGRLILLSMLGAFITQEVAALLVLPVAVVARGLAGTGGAFHLLAFVPGPGLLWGVIVGYIAFDSNRS